MRCMETVEAGAYVLGALSPAERSVYERHMAACNECRNEVADLAGLPGLLGRLDESTASGLAGPDGSAAPGLPPAPPMVLPNLLGKVREERFRNRRRHRWRTGVLAAAAACLALLVGLGGSMVIQQNAAPAKVVLDSMVPVQQGEPVVAVIGFQAAPDGGTEIYMSCTYADASGSDEMWTLQLWIHPRQGDDVMPRDWDASPGQHINFHAHTQYAPSDIERIDVKMANGTRLLSYRVT
jgi:hypothetical protein